MSALRPVLAPALVALLALAPSRAAAQEPAPAGTDWQRSVSVMVGGIFSEAFVSEGRTFPVVGARADWRLSRYVLTEAGLSYARGKVEMGNYTGPTPTFSEETTSLGSATVGLQAELPLPYARPYVGIATGLYLRMDPEGGHRFLSTTQEFPVGVRIPLSERLGARAEVRVRYDEQQGNGPALGGETTLGVSWRF